VLPLPPLWEYIAVGIDNPRKEMPKCGITICRSYIVLIIIGDESVSLMLTIIE